jgi:hypothetical protein
MLIINTHNNKLAAAQHNFSSHGMLDDTCLSKALKKLENDSEDINDVDSGTEGNPLYHGGEDDQDLNANEDKDGTGPVDRPHTLSEVTLAWKQSGYCLPSHIFYHF